MAKQNDEAPVDETPTVKPVKERIVELEQLYAQLSAQMEQLKAQQQQVVGGITVLREYENAVIVEVPEN